MAAADIAVVLHRVQIVVEDEAVLDLVHQEIVVSSRKQIFSLVVIENFEIFQIETDLIDMARDQSVQTSVILDHVRHPQKRSEIKSSKKESNLRKEFLIVC